MKVTQIFSFLFNGESLQKESTVQSLEQNSFSVLDSPVSLFHKVKKTNPIIYVKLNLFFANAFTKTGSNLLLSGKTRMIIMPE